MQVHPVGLPVQVQPVPRYQTALDAAYSPTSSDGSPLRGQVAGSPTVPLSLNRGPPCEAPAEAPVSPRTAQRQLGEANVYGNPNQI